MVVTRRAPAPPVPASRTNSAQPIPRVKGKAPHTVPDVPSPLANGSSRAEPVTGVDQSKTAADAELDLRGKKGKGKQKGKQKKDKKPKKKTTFVEFLTRIFLLGFTIYTLSVCPTDDKLQSPVCRGLHEYRRLVLEPYLLPPVQHALSHPVVAPYVDRAKPFVNRAIAITTPVVVRAHREWTTRVVPQWDKTIVPQWRKHVVPQWKRHVNPQLERVAQQLEPYVVRAQVEYERRLGPHLRLAAYNAHRFQQQARPYVVLAAHKTYDGYQVAKPYAVPVLRRLQLLLARLAQFLGERRRQFVDPHVKKIWERVNELSSGDVPVVSDNRSKLTATSSVLASTNVPGSAEAPMGSSSSAVTSALDVPTSVVSAQDAVQVTPEVIEVLPTVDPIDGASSASSAISVAASAASSVSDRIASSGASFASAASSVILQQEPSAAPPSSQDSESLLSSSKSAQDGPLASVPANSPAVTPASRAASIQESHSSSVPTASVVTDHGEASSATLVSTDPDAADEIDDAPPVDPTQSTDDTEEDFLAKFYAELGLDKDILSENEEASESDAAAAPAETETEEEKAEKLRLKMEENVKKRAEITARHANWEKQLQERMAENRKTLRKSLVASRKAAAQALKESEDIRKEVEHLVEEAERYLRGAEKYMDNLRRETRSDDEKKTIWDRVVEKVDKKFTERLAQTETSVNGWYLKVVEAELQEVRRLAAEVRDIADRAQADIGLDYAWLDDVTYEDWQRYHDLERKSDNFTAHAQSIQDGTHPSPPINPVLPALEDLQNEVQDVIVGFETRLRRIKRNGERAFGAALDDNDAPSDETVSILPIEDDAHRDASEGDSPAVPPVVIGRSKDEILSALDRAADLEAQATSASEEKNVDPEQVVESMVKEAEAETASQVVFHNEL
ncbi:hypothetical protein EIP86_008019 [Pleurotus ostreatoroseus]|nr:hypothetical protein EIP86_008019 [Pleurotus ostreatoroseus]